MSDDILITPNAQSTVSTFATVATVNNNHQQLHTASQQAAVASSSEVAGAVANDTVFNAPSIQSTVSTSTTVVHTPSQVAAEVEARNKNKTLPVFSVGSNNGHVDAYERSGGTSSAEDWAIAEQATRRGMFNEGRQKDGRVNKHKNSGRDNRDKLVAKKRQDAASPPTTGLPRSQRGSRTIEQDKEEQERGEKEEQAR